MIIQSFDSRHQRGSMRTMFRNAKRRPNPEVSLYGCWKRLAGLALRLPSSDMHDRDVSQFPLELALGLVAGGVVFAIVGIAWTVVAGLIAAALTFFGVIWFLNQ
jgi:hypothetical protein